MRENRGGILPSRPLERAEPTHGLSVIVPARNEENTIGLTLKRLREADAGEVIVVDGQSTDRTCEVARSLGAEVLHAPRSRGGQLNAGAARATGDTLLFLHADTSPPAGFKEHIFRTLGKPGVIAGAFRLTIDAPGMCFRWIEKAVNYRSRRWQLPYGDQALFLRADVFHRVGGFDDFPIMEDYVFVRRLRRLGRIEIARACVLTSARRWLEQGVWRTTLRNQACLTAYRLGLSPTRIARWRDS